MQALIAYPCALDLDLMKKNVRFLDFASQALMNNAIVPKSRRPKFEVLLKIQDLTNVPLVTGSVFASWSVAGSIATEHKGRTSREAIKDHKVVWDYAKSFHVRVTADKNGVLQNAELQLEIVQEYNSGSKEEKVPLGVVKVNLAEYVDASFDETEGVSRRYLMQESKINSTLGISILMTQIEGEKNFVAPPLKTAPIFQGIAGIMNQEQSEPVDLGMSSMKSSSREQQDSYRKTLAASWSGGNSELPADQCIEDIFAGGDGWGNKDGPDSAGFISSDAEHLQVPIANHRKIFSYLGRGHHRQRSQNAGVNTENRSQGGGTSSGRSSPDPTGHSSSSDDHIRSRRRLNEVSEIDMRDDLRSWEIRNPKG